MTNYTSINFIVIKFLNGELYMHRSINLIVASAVTSLRVLMKLADKGDSLCLLRAIGYLIHTTLTLYISQIMLITRVLSSLRQQYKKWSFNKYSLLIIYNNDTRSTKIH